MLYSFLKRIVFYVLTAILCYSVILPARASSPLVIGEVNWAGSSLSTSDEWIELWNLGDTELSLDGYKLTGAGAQTISFGAADTIPAQGTFIVSNFYASDTRSHLDMPADLVTSTISLANDKMLIELVDQTGATLDQAGNDTAPFAGISGAQKSSMVRRFPISDGATQNAWTTSTSAFYLKEGSFELMTPGLCDGCLLEPPVLEEVDPPPTDTASTSTEIVVTNDQTISPDPSDETDEGINPLPEQIMINAPDTTSTTTADMVGADPVMETTETVAGTSTEQVITTEEEIETTEEGPAIENGVHETISTDTSLLPPLIEMEITGEMMATKNIRFDASRSSDPNGDELVYAWDFGDGMSSTQTTVDRAYRLPGTYLITLSISNGTRETYATTTLTIAPQPLELRLNEVMANPPDGSEWVELYAPDITEASQLEGWSIKDDSGVIFRFNSSTNHQIVLLSPYVQAKLTSAKIRNSGESISLFDPSGTPVDETTVPETKKGTAYARVTDGNGSWQITEQPTPVAANTIKIFVAPLPVTASPIASVAIAKPKITVTKTTTTPKKTTTPPPVVASTSAKPKTIPVSPKKETVTTKKKTTTTKPAAPKKSTIKKSEALADITIDQLKDMPSNVRVKLTGVVATRPGLLSQNQFVIQTDDGRGLLVKGNGKWVSPPYQALVQVAGTLVINDQGATLQMTSKDGWLLLKTQANVMPRAIDLFAPSWEDAWSLLDVTGTVRDVKGTSVSLDVDDTPITVTIRPILNYRAQRLQKGDVIRVQGIVDTRQETIKMYPRVAEEITIVRQVEKPKPPVTVKSPFPSWAPFGAAGATLALSQGVRRFKKIQEQKRLQRLLKAAELEMT